MSFLRMEAENRLRKNDLVVRLDEIVDWSRIERLLGNLGRSGVGPKGYNPLGMAKSLILQNFYSLSDAGLEEALRIRLDFLHFTKFEDGTPDETTICRFRNKLNELGIVKKLLNEVNSQLQARGLQVAPSEGAILDATIIASQARPKKIHETQEVDSEHEVTGVTLSSDSDAAWGVKGKNYFFGYKGFAVVSKDGSVQRGHLTPANKSECTELEPVIRGLEAEFLLADKGYASQKNREFLADRGIQDGIMFKASKGNPLNAWQKEMNRSISKGRFVVEQTFGILKRRFTLVRFAYRGIEAALGQFLMKGLVLNLNKAMRQVNCA